MAGGSSAEVACEECDCSMELRGWKEGDGMMRMMAEQREAESHAHSCE